MNEPVDLRLARGAARRGLLLDAAVRVVAARGSGSLTHRAVASEAEVSLASVTYHFPSIGELRRATLQHAGTGIGMELVGLVRAATATVDDTPTICAAFAVRLVTQRRVETAAVFEMIVAAGHDPELRPVVAFYNDRLADLLEPYLDERDRALQVGAAVQGLLLVRMSSSSPTGADALAEAVANLIRRSRADGPRSDGQDRPDRAPTS
jgi:DNA-binding transcriptional regulator YbjK